MSKWKNNVKTLGCVAVRMNKTGKVEYLTLVKDYYSERKAWEEAWKQDSYELEEDVKLTSGETVDVIIIPEALAHLKRDYGVFGSKATCQYDSIEKYLKNFWGINLTRDDANWFQDHPLVIAGGVPMAHTLTVAQQLIQPYGFRVSYCRVQPGTHMQDELHRWAKILGTNPIGLADRRTSNAQFCEQTGLETEKAARQFRLEYSSEILKPSVSCDGAMATGHATYRSLRARHKWDFVLQFQIDKAENVDWKNEDQIEEPELGPENLILDICKCIGDDGKELRPLPYQTPAGGRMPWQGHHDW